MYVAAPGRAHVGKAAAVVADRDFNNASVVSVFNAQARIERRGKRRAARRLAARA